MSRWIRSSKPTTSRVAPAPGVVLPGVPLAATALADPRPASPPDPLAGPAPRLADRRDLDLTIVTGRAPTEPVVPVAEPVVPVAEEIVDIDTDSDAVDEADDDRGAADIVEAEVVDPSPRSAHQGAGTVVRGPWPEPGSAGWPTVVPAWGAPPPGFGQRPITATLGFADGSTVHATPEVAGLLRQAAAQLGA
jgi:hypothetical protein